MRADLITQISELNEIDHVVILTHNIDFVFFQTIFISALRKCGHPKVTLFADAGCARESYEFQSTMITGLGKRFRIIPVSMSPGFRFHPKAVFLSGSKQGVLFVGSGNMTFGGMTENAEVWKRFDTRKGDYRAFAGFRDYLNQMTARVAFKEAVQLDLAEIFDRQNNQWAENAEEPGDLVGQFDSAESLLSKITASIADKPVDHITVSVPYFDSECAALKALSQTFNDPPIDVLVQSKRSTLFSEASLSLPENITLKNVSIIDASGEEKESPRFIHAKYYAFKQDQEIRLFAGSANCSRAALLRNGSSGNAELMSYQIMTTESFQTEFLDEFNINDIPPELVSKEEVEEESSSPKIHLLGARFDISTIDVEFWAAAEVTITGCLVDDIKRDFKLINVNALQIPIEAAPSSITLEGTFDNSSIQSNEMWVDNEPTLRTSSKGRALLDEIRKQQTSDSLELNDWNLLVELFAQDLNYTTPRELRERERNQASDSDNPQETIYTYEDVFSDSYDAPPSATSHSSDKSEGNTASIISSLLHAFGVSPAPLQDPESDEPDVTDDSDGDQEVVDRAKKLEFKTSKKIASRKKKELARAAKLVLATTSTLTDETFLSLRDPRLLGRDLQIAGILLREAYSKGWINTEQFFIATQQIWSTLFFSSPKDKSLGWISIRYKEARDKQRFKSELCSPQLAATLFAWVMAIDLDKESGPLVQCFLVSILLSIGRHPWLWYEGVDKNETNNHISRIIEKSPCGLGETPDQGKLHCQRIALIRQGAALSHLETVLASEDVKSIRDRILDTEVREGDFLWQGKRGICIALDNSFDRDRVEVICLQEPTRNIVWMSNSLMPLRAILNSNKSTDRGTFGEPQIRHLLGVLDRLDSLKSQRREVDQ